MNVRTADQETVVGAESSPRRGRRGWVLGAVAAAVVALAVRRLGGFTGDVLGAAGMVGETAGLLAAAATW